MREEVVRGRRSVALQVLSHVVALFCAFVFFLRTFTFFVSKIFRIHFSLSAVSYSSTVWILFFYSLFNESMAHASVVSLMWPVQKETAAE